MEARGGSQNAPTLPRIHVVLGRFGFILASPPFSPIASPALPLPRSPHRPTLALTLVLTLPSKPATPQNKINAGMMLLSHFACLLAPLPPLAPLAPLGGYLPKSVDFPLDFKANLGP